MLLCRAEAAKARLQAEVELKRAEEALEEQEIELLQLEPNDEQDLEGPREPLNRTW